MAVAADAQSWGARRLVTEALADAEIRPRRVVDLPIAELQVVEAQHEESRQVNGISGGRSAGLPA